MFVAFLERFRNSLLPEHHGNMAVLLIDNCRSHCVAPALQLLAHHNCKVISFPPHMTHVLQPIDVSCARAFKAALAKNMEIFTNNAELLPGNFPSAASRSRAITVAASLAALGHCDMTVCLNGYMQCGLFPFNPEKALGSRYVHQSDVDPELVERMRRPGTFHCGSSVMTDPMFLAALNQWTTRNNNHRQ
jgi:hypothetical protein